MCGLIRLAVGRSESRRVGVGEVQVVGQLGMLAGNGGDTLYRRHHTHLLAVLTNLQVLLLHIGTLCLQYEAGNLEVREATLFHFEQQLGGQFLQLVVLLQLVLQVDDVLQTLQEPDVNLGQLLDTLYSVAFLQSLCDSKDAQVGRILQGVVQVVELGVVVAHETVHALTNHTETLLNHLFERASDRHNLTNRLHAGANLTAHTSKLGKVPTRNLTNHVVE